MEPRNQFLGGAERRCESARSTRRMKSVHIAGPSIDVIHRTVFFVGGNENVRSPGFSAGRGWISDEVKPSRYATVTVSQITQVFGFTTLVASAAFAASQ